jgi:hypothetical protein
MDRHKLCCATQMSFCVLLALLLCGFTSSASAESINYEIYALHRSGDELLAKGTLTYMPRDVQVVERVSSKHGRFWDKSVRVWEDFSIGASVYREQSLCGFGLWIQKGVGGFSWDWFTQESGNTYRKLQGGGRVRVVLAPSKAYEELVAIEFLDNVTLRFRESLFFGDTHHIVVHKGSVLRLAP